ncbi:plasma kallikrein [Chanos chanos]|uniref:Plasma kallikrein n=1 Tax=Chanos chanos TaxID=29144 RepID=A0A6J2WM15_CHACN|nr:plasma kallikrein-like [Chanos chanos]
MSCLGFLKNFSKKTLENKFLLQNVKTRSSIDFPGHDFEQFSAASAKHCQFLCSIHPRCTYFSYTTQDYQSKRMHCFLKHNHDVKPSVTKQDVWSGMPQRFCQSSKDWIRTQYENIDFRGSDIRHITMDDEHNCQTACAHDPDCQFYTYVKNSFTPPEYRQRCYLKQVITVPVPPKVVSMNGVVSGFSLRSCSSEVPETDCGVAQIEKARVLGGSDVSPGQWPWQISLQKNRKHVCGGVIIARQWVVTAAHCLSSAYNALSVLAGITELSVSGEKYELDKKFIHPGYDVATLENDIALLKLTSPLTYGRDIAPLCLMDKTKEMSLFGQSCTVTGWGRLSSGSHSTVLQAAEVPLMSPESCAALKFGEDSNYKVLDTNVCAGYPQGGIDTCDGDSGGPLACSIEYRWYLTGITSWGQGCGLANKPGVYTRVSRYLDWIRNTMSSN